MFLRRGKPVFFFFFLHGSNFFFFFFFFFFFADLPSSPQPCSNIGSAYTHHLTVTHAFFLNGKDLAASRMCGSFDNTCLLRDVNSLELILLLVLWSFILLPCKFLKFSSDKHLAGKTCFLLALTSAKMVSVLHGLSFSFLPDCKFKEFPFLV